MEIGIFGAGAIGCYLGVRLSASGRRVRLLARPSVVAVADVLRATDRAGATTRAVDLVASDDPEVLRGVDVCLVTVKSQDTATAGGALATLLEDDALVVSLQNGLDNARLLDDAIAGTVVQGVVTYNVYRESTAETRQATLGKLVIGRSRRATSTLGWLADALRGAGEIVELSSDIDGEVAGKLLVNLNNGVCAATGLAIVASLRDRDARWCFARCMAEGHRVLRYAGMRPTSPFALPLPAIARALTLPNAIVLRIARRLVSAHPSAKSSTLQDLERGRATEIGDLNGTILRLAAEHGVPCPANRAVVDAVRAHEAAIRQGQPIRFLTPRALRVAIRDGEAQR